MKVLYQKYGTVDDEKSDIIEGVSVPDLSTLEYTWGYFCYNTSKLLLGI